MTPSGSGKSYDERNAMRFYEVMGKGFMGTLVEYNLVDKFIMSDRHTVGASAVFVRYHAIFYFGVDAHIEFTDADDNRKSYCRGAVIVLTGTWTESKSLIFKIIFQWKSIW